MIYSVRTAAAHIGIAPRTMRKYARLHGCARLERDYMITPQELHEIHSLLLARKGAGRPMKGLKKTLTPRPSWRTLETGGEDGR